MSCGNARSKTITASRVAFWKRTLHETKRLFMIDS